MYRKLILFLPLCLLFLLGGGCSTEISVRKADDSERIAYEYYGAYPALMPATVNLLANYLLKDLYDKDPPGLLKHLRALYLKEPGKEFISALADTALNCAVRYEKDPEKAISYYLSSAFYAYMYLAHLDDPEENPYNAGRIRIMQIYNMAASEIFAYLRNKGLYRKDAYSLSSACGEIVTFRKVTYSLPLPERSYKDFQLCADYKPLNLTHTTRHSGLGVPLICELHNAGKKGEELFAKDQMLPATLMIHFSYRKGEKIDAGLSFLDTRNVEKSKVGKRNLPLEMDFSTPVAYMAKKPLPFGGLGYMLFPEKSSHMQGLYKFEPFHEKRIPVLLVHGLMSNTRTWMQMLNTLQNDPILRKYYQFWGFSYSSGNPILYSASLLRKALREERARLVREKKDTSMFDRMVIVGHSMGGLLSKTAIMDPGEQLKEALLAGIDQKILAGLHKEEAEFLRELWQFNSLPFVKRVIFIAVPHRGSTFARAWIGRLGSSLVELPRQLVSPVKNVIKKIFPGEEKDFRKLLPTGIDNLDPDNRALKALARVEFVKGIPYHSIIGNTKEKGVPGGTDGIVPYTSSHLDGAQSELIVQCGHSAQQNPLAIQEVRRILLEHVFSLRNKGNTGNVP